MAVGPSAARITETATRVRIAFTAACPEAALFASLARRIQPAGPRHMGHAPRTRPVPPIPNAWQIWSEIAMGQRVA